MGFYVIFSVLYLSATAEAVFGMVHSAVRSATHTISLSRDQPKISFFKGRFVEACGPSLRLSASPRAARPARVARYVLFFFFSLHEFSLHEIRERQRAHATGWDNRL